VVLFGIKLVGLVDVKPPIVPSLFNERRLCGGETRHDTSLVFDHTAREIVSPETHMIPSPQAIF
jgi:hypothetical protein